MHIYKELYEYLKSADIEAQNRALGNPDYVFDLTYEEFCKQIIPLEHAAPVAPDSYGFRGKKHSDKTKAKMGQMKKDQKRSQEARENISKGMLASANIRARHQTGDKNPMFGKKHSDETRAKMSRTRKGKPGTSLGKTWTRPEEANKKLAEAVKGRKKYTRPDGTWTWIYPLKTLD